MEGTHLSLAEQLSQGILIDSLAYVDKEVGLRKNCNFKV